MKPLTSSNERVSSGIAYASVLASVIVMVAFAMAVAMMAVSTGSWLVILLVVFPFELPAILFLIQEFRRCQKYHRWVWFDEITGKFQVGREGQQVPFPISSSPRIERRGNVIVIHLQIPDGPEVAFLPTWEFYRHLKNDRYPVLRALAP